MPAYDTPPPPPVDVLRTQPTRSGPMALALGGVFLVALAGLFGFRLYKIEELARPARERSLVKTAKLARAAILYAEDQGAFPDHYGWEKRLLPLGIQPVDLESPIGKHNRYNIRRGSGRYAPSKISDPSTYALFFDGYEGRPYTMPAELDSAWQNSFYKKGRETGNVFSFADGHSAFIPKSKWHPETTDQGPVR